MPVWSSPGFTKCCHICSVSLSPTLPQWGTPVGAGCFVWLDLLKVVVDINVAPLILQPESPQDKCFLLHSTVIRCV